MKRKKRNQQLLIVNMALLIAILVIIVVIVILTKSLPNSSKGKENNNKDKDNGKKNEKLSAEEKKALIEKKIETLIAEADTLKLGCNFEAANAKVDEALKLNVKNEKAIGKKEDIQAAQNNLVEYKGEINQVFFHELIVFQWFNWFRLKRISIIN